MRIGAPLVATPLGGPNALLTPRRMKLFHEPYFLIASLALGFAILVVLLGYVWYPPESYNQFYRGVAVRVVFSSIGWATFCAVFARLTWRDSFLLGFCWAAPSSILVVGGIGSLKSEGPHALVLWGSVTTCLFLLFVGWANVVSTIRKKVRSHA